MDLNSSNSMKDSTVWTKVKMLEVKDQESFFKGVFERVSSEIKSGNTLQGIKFGKGEIGFVFGTEPEVETKDTAPAEDPKMIPSMTRDDLQSMKKGRLDDVVKVRGTEMLIKEVPMPEGPLMVINKIVKHTGMSFDEVASIVFTAGCLAATVVAEKSKFDESNKGVTLMRDALDELHIEGILGKSSTVSSKPKRNPFANALEGGNEEVLGDKILGEDELPQEIKDVLNKMRDSGMDVTASGIIAVNRDTGEATALDRNTAQGLFDKLKKLLGKDDDDDEPKKKR